MSSTVVGYWDIRGLAEPIRYLLHYKEVPFEDKRYAFEERDAWMETEKFKLGLDFPNLPYLFDGDVKLTQSTAILRYLARKHGLAGKNEEETIRIEMAEQQVSDFRMNLIRLAYDPKFESLKDDFIRNVPAQLKLFSAFLGDRKFFVGDRITYVDFMAYDAFDFYRLLVPDVLKDFQSLQDFQDRIEGLPAMQKYMKSPVYKSWPIFSPIAYFGGKGEPPEVGQGK